MDEATRISLKDQFNSLLVHAIEGRRGGMALMRVLEELDFYNSPASAKHHENTFGMRRRRQGCAGADGKNRDTIDTPRPNALPTDSRTDILH